MKKNNDEVLRKRIEILEHHVEANRMVLKVVLFPLIIYQLFGFYPMVFYLFFYFFTNLN
jgi:hypothetical protein